MVATIRPSTIQTTQILNNKESSASNSSFSTINSIKLLPNQTLKPIIIKQNPTTTITNTTKNKMSCSIDETVTLIEKQNQTSSAQNNAQTNHLTNSLVNSLPITITGQNPSSPTSIANLTSCETNSNTNNISNNGNNNQANLTLNSNNNNNLNNTVKTMINNQNGNTIGNNTMSLNLNGIGTMNTNANQMPTKIVQAGNQFIITTVYQTSTQKVVTVAPSSLNPNSTSNNNNNNNSNSSSPPSITILNTNSNNLPSSSSIGSSSSSSNTNQDNTTPLTTVSMASNVSNTGSSATSALASASTVPSTTASNNSTTNSQSSSSSTILYPLQSHNQQQQFSFVDSNQGSSGVSVFSPIGGTTQYYTYQPNSNFNHQPSIISSSSNNIAVSANNLTSPNRNISNAVLTEQHQQTQQQAQQPIYMMYHDNSTIDTDNTPIEFEGHVAHTAQAAPITVQWLIENFEPAEGCSLRRSTLYNYYIHHCSEQKLEPVNPASFGKLIRSVFLGLRTRRLGTRGNSKYHYYGIRVKISSPLNHLAEDHIIAIRNHPLSLSPTGSPQQPPQSPNSTTTPHLNGPTPNKRLKSNTAYTNANLEQNNAAAASTGNIDYKPNILTTIVSNNNEPTHQQISNHSNQPLMTVILSNPNSTIAKTAPVTTAIAKNSNKNESRNHNHEQNAKQTVIINQTIPADNQSATNGQFNNTNNQNTNAPNSTTSPTGDELIKICLGETNQMPNFGTVNLENLQLPPGCTLDDVKKFEELYKQHCDKILDMVVGLKLNNIENIWLMFWRSSTVDFKYYEDQLPSSKFFNLCEVSQIIEFVKQCDYQFYQFCIEILIPDVMGSLPHNLVQSIRSLAKSLENWLRNALANAPDKIKESKLLIISTFSMTLRRYTSLNHLVQTVRNSLQNESILVQMLNDISRVDFGYIREQAKWTCECEEKLVNKFEKEFKDSLKNPSAWSMEKWITWLDSSVSFYLNQFEGTDKYAKAARQFLLKWSFLCSSIVRDLTLRSAPSFGSFHLIRLLYDEYMYYIIEHKIANEYRQTPLAIMSTFDFKNLSNNSALQ